MKQKIQRILCLCLILSILTTITFPAMAIEADQERAQQIVETPIKPAFEVIASITPSLSMRNGTANVFANINGYSNCTSFKIIATIQKKNYFWWNDVKSFPSKTVYSSAGSFSGSSYVGSGTFRVKAQVISYQNGVQKDNVTVYS